MARVASRWRATRRDLGLAMVSGEEDGITSIICDSTLLYNPSYRGHPEEQPRRILNNIVRSSSGPRRLRHGTLVGFTTKKAPEHSRIEKKGESKAHAVLQGERKGANLTYISHGEAYSDLTLYTS